MRHALPCGVACVAALAFSASLPLPAATARMPLDEVRPGMTGTGITVFEGTTRERFDVHVLGVLTNAVGPRRNLVVARLEGGPLAETGVIQGMSGSPVYVGERLVGAVSYALGVFATEAIAGITPIEEMAATDAAGGPDRSAGLAGAGAAVLAGAGRAAWPRDRAAWLARGHGAGRPLDRTAGLAGGDGAARPRDRAAVLAGGGGSVRVRDGLAAFAAAPAPPAAEDLLVHLGGELLRRARPFARHPADVLTAGLPAAEGGRLGALLRPIGTPLGLSGFVPEVHALWSEAFGGAGIVTAAGGAAVGAVLGASGGAAAGGTAQGAAAVAGAPQGASAVAGAPQGASAGGAPQGAAQRAAAAGGAPQGAATAPAELLQPGDAVGATLMRGDFTMAGTGTVTLVDEGRVYAFGHPFYNVGPARFPMTRARVTTLLPSRAQSARLDSVGEVLGTIDQDRATGIYGTLGAGPAMVPVTVTLAADDRDLRERFAFEVVDDRVLTPLLTYTGVLNTFFAWTRQVGAGTYRVDGTASLRGRPAVTFGNVFAGDAAAAGAAATVAAPLMTLAVNRLEPVAFDRIDIAVTSSSEPRSATVERAWIDADRLRAGATVPLRVALRDSEGRIAVETLPLALPPHVTGPVQLLVADATRAGQRDLASGSHPRSARTLPQLIRTLNGLRRNDRIYVRLIVPRRGAVVGGEPLPGLPASVLAVVQGDRAGGDVADLHDVTVGTWEIATDRVVTGSRLLSLTVEAG